VIKKVSLEAMINKSGNYFFINRNRKSLMGKIVVYGLTTILKFGGGYALIGCDDENRLEKNDVVRVVFDNVRVNSKVADTPEKKAKGLMFHNKLRENEGMLFIYDSEGVHKFWMKNVFFPIDIIWIDSSLTVVYIKKNAPPCTTVQCQIYTPPVTAKYVLEVMANFTEKYEIKVGDQAEIVW
jgi:uncharacterized membrane protein (UPF0127 family)